MTTLINQILNLIIGGAVGLFGLQAACKIFKKGNYNISEQNSKNLAIGILGGFIGSNIGNLLDDSSNQHSYYSSIWNMFGSDFSLIPSVIGAFIFALLLGAFLRKFA